jgi:hypothetical protein
VARAAAQLRRVGARGALDQDVESPAHESLRTLARAALDDLHSRAIRSRLTSGGTRPASRAASVPRRGE